jgi:hypothetical protein
MRSSEAAYRSIEARTIAASSGALIGGGVLELTSTSERAD